MENLSALNPDEASGKTKDLFNAVQQKLGMVPNMMRTMGNSSAVLEGYLNFSGALNGGKLGAKTSALIALTVAELNACNYCLSAHSFIGEKLAGIDKETLTAAREGKSTSSKIQAALDFATVLVTKKGGVSTHDIQAVKEAGYNDGEVSEIIAQVALNIFTNYLNKAANTQIDFPEVHAYAEVASV
jgi:uncharacterized peroxidase-related enzyme